MYLVPSVLRLYEYLATPQYRGMTFRRAIEIGAALFVLYALVGWIIYIIRVAAYFINERFLIKWWLKNSLPEKIREITTKLKKNPILN
jgi:hypothetical protein